MPYVNRETSDVMRELIPSLCEKPHEQSVLACSRRDFPRLRKKHDFIEAEIA